MGTGKSTVGRCVAELAGRAYVDLDRVIETRAGTSIPEIFRARGEHGFRELELGELRALLDSAGPVVVSLGGGALLRRPIRLEALDRAVVVTLEATAEEILARTSGSTDRPLLHGPDRLSRIGDLLEDRRLAYAECQARVATTGRDPDEIAREVLSIWQRDCVAVAAGAASYAVDIGVGIASRRVSAAVSGATSALLVTDRNVAPLHGAALESAIAATCERRSVITLEPGEEHKGIPSLERIWLGALSAGCDRKARFVALGGGVVCDVTGFAASTWMRGVGWVSVPTTLLAMVDASVGGKTAIDLESAKNAVGTFWQPRAVVCDAAHLSTEGQRGYTSALAEVVKTALIGDAELLSLLEERAEAVLRRDLDVVSELVRRSVRVKARVVSADEREDGIRAWLNLGHTVGHALEAHAGYGALPHGEAVGLGLVAALRVGERLGLTEVALTERTIAALERLGLPSALPRSVIDAAALIGHDKKRAGARLRFVVARAPGHVELVELGLEELRTHIGALVS